MPVGIRDWVLPWLPRLTEALGPRRRARLLAGSGAASLARTMAGMGSIHPVADILLAPVAQLGSVSGTARISASVVRRAYGQAVAVTDRPLHAAVILTTVPDDAQPSIAPIPTDVASLRLAQSAAYERRSFHLIGERARFHFAARPPIPGFDAVAHEATVLAERLAGVPTFELRTPFPGNPAVAAELILSVV
jgi:hypothetical protein